MCWPVPPWLFGFFSMPSPRPTLNNLSVDLLLGPSMSAPPSSGYSVAVSAVALRPLTSLANKIAVDVVHALQQSVPTFLLLCFMQRTSSPVFKRGSSLCLQSRLPCLFQFCLGCYQVAFLSCRYIEIAAILCLSSLLFLPHQVLCCPTWLG